MALVASEHAVGDDDGLQLFCTKYSTLISRLREEILGRQKAEADLRMLQRRLRDEVTLRESEEKRWEDQRESLRLENSRLQALWHQQQQQEERRQERRQEQQQQQQQQQQQHDQQQKQQQHHQQRPPPQAAQTPQKHSPAAAILVTPETPGGHHGARGTAAGEAAAAGTSDVLIRQGQELSALRREHAELGLRHREAREELAACREHLAKLRKANAELEVKLASAHTGQEEAQVRLRKLQEETRQALRSASNAKAREASAASLAGRSERELQAREARLESVRREGRRMAHRAASAERELAKADGLEATVHALTQANKDFSMRLNAEVLARDAARSEAAHAQNAEARAKQALLEAQSEIKASEAWARERQTRTLDVESELAMLHSKLEREHDEHGRTVEITEKLRAELQTMREECEALRQQRDKTVGDATEKGRKLDRTGVQLTECKKRVASSEEVMSRLRSEVVEERKAREKCHLEAMRATERLRATRHQCTQLRDRVRALEEADLRYPSRFMPQGKPSTKEVNLDAQLLSRDDEDLGITFEQSPGRGGGGGGGASFTFEAREPPLGAADLRGSSRSGFGSQSTPELASPVASARGLAREPTSVSKDRPQISSQPRRPEVPSAGCAPQLGNGVPGASHCSDMQAMRSFLAMEDQRLANLAAGSFHRGDAPRLSTSLEEPRVAAPTPTPARPMEEWYRPEKREQPSDWPLTQSSQSNELPPVLPDPSLSQELVSLLAAEPRVLRLPERCADVGGMCGADTIGRASAL